MSAAATLVALRDAGVRVRLRPDGRLHLNAVAPPPPALLDRVRRHRDELALLLAQQGQDAAVPSDLPSAWRDGVARLQTAPSPPGVALDCWRTFQADAERLLRRHGAELHAAGWDSLDLFGLHARAPNRRMDAAGLAWLLRGRSVGAVTTETVAIVSANGQKLRCWRMGAQARQEAVPAWALHNMAEATIQHHLSTSASEDRT